MADFNKIYDAEVNPFTAMATVEYVDCADLTPEPNLIGKFAEGAVAQWMPNGAAAPIPIAAQADGTFFDRYDAPLTNLSNAFRDSGLTALYQLPDTSQVDTYFWMFKGTPLKTFDAKIMNVGNATILSGVFGTCEQLKTIDLSTWKTPKTTAINAMFQECSTLQSVDVSGFDTSNVETMAYMFFANYALPKIDISHFDLAAVKDMSSMFAFDGKLEYLMMNGFGANEEVVITDIFRGCTKWGSGAANNLASLTATLVYNSFDRAAAGYSTLTVTLPQAVINRLTGQQLGIITKKGYTIAVES